MPARRINDKMAKVLVFGAQFLQGSPATSVSTAETTRACVKLRQRIGMESYYRI